MTQQIDTAQMIETLEAFLCLFNEYRDALRSTGKVRYVTGPRRNEQLADPDEIMRRLRRMEPQITDILLKVLGDGSLTISPLGTLSRRDLLSNAFLAKHQFHYFIELVISSVERAIGTLQAALWPPKIPTPVLIIRDDELRQRCADLLARPGNYDTVIREATTVLEDRIKRRMPSDLLANLIPHTGDRTLGKLIDELFSPNKQVLSISSDRTRQVALFKMLQGVDSYLRNHYHHQLDPATEQSWAWSTVGLIDHLLADIDVCEVQTP